MRPVLDPLEKKAPPADPAVIQGGMGVWISWWVLARIVSMMGGLGVVSGTALEVVYARLLQQGDPGGHARRAFAELARRRPALAEDLQRILERYFLEGGKAPDAPFLPVPVWNLRRVDGEVSGWEPSRELQVLTIAANFAEVWLAKEGHAGLVGVNYLRKIERPLPWAIYGAMLAEADHVIVGAGAPPEIPGLLRRLARHEAASLPLKVHGAGSEAFSVLARPRTLVGESEDVLPMPRFLAIVASFGLAQALASDPATRPYGFIIEGAGAGGHSAPPGKRSFDAQGRPVLVYTDEDRADVGAIAGLGLPFWLAGSYASPQALREAFAAGARGVQIGTVPALSGQSGLRADLRAQILKLVADGGIEVAADALVSPTGFPFKIAKVPGTLADADVYEKRERVCDLGQLQVAYKTPEGGLGFRCPAEPVEDFVRKGGRAQNTAGRACLCNGLMSTAGLAQVRAGGYVEPAIVTLGEDLRSVRALLASLPPGQSTYSIGKALRFIRKD